MSTVFEEYKSKLVSADEAVKVIKSGDLVHYGEFMNASQLLDEALAKRKDELKDVIIRAVSCLFPPKTILSDPEGEHFTFHEGFFSPVGRYLADNNLCFHDPLTYSEVVEYFTKGYTPVNVAMCTVGPMDKHGYFNIGPSNSGNYAFTSLAGKVIIEVNQKMPICLGGNRESIHISAIDYIVEGENQPLLAVPEAVANDAEKKIAQMLLEEIEDGACLQLGIGGMPNTVGKLIAQSDLKDIGIHTEMLCDSMMEMFEAGRITGKRKKIDAGKMVYTFAMGSSKLYDWLDRNPACASYPCDYTNEPNIIRLNDNVVSINNCLEVDLFAQVASESSGPRQISGTGGQLDFVIGGYKSKGGKSFLCMTSTTILKNGELESRIKPTITPGGIVTIHRSLVNTLVTEYGMVRIKGLSTWQRAEALISIAHPQFRDDLVKEAQAMKIWRKSNKINEL